MKSDMQIQQDVIAQLKWEPVLNAAEIGVSVKNGVVTLSGMVDAYAKKIAAENAAKKVFGVKAVAEDIQVGVSPASRKTDTEIAEAVINMLNWNSFVPAGRIKVKVEDGIVSLEGEVDWNYQRNAAKSSIESVTGVRRINNFIRVKPSVSAPDVKQKITAALLRSATIDSQKISVEVIGTKVILKGTVRSFAEREDAGFAAWAAPGVTAVENDLLLTEDELVF